MKTPVRAIYPNNIDNMRRLNFFKHFIVIMITIMTTVSGVGSAAAADSTGEKPARMLRILAFGDSLTAGYGLPAADGFTEQLENALQTQGYDVEIINGGVSGDTTTGGLARLDWALSDNPDAVILELGANDGLRAIDPRITQSNLARILEALREKELPVLLTGMVAPPNLGREYSYAFNMIYPQLAREYETGFYPFFLDGVATEPKLNQEDGIHPNAKGVSIIVERMLPYVVNLIKSIDQ